MPRPGGAFAGQASARRDHQVLTRSVGRGRSILRRMSSTTQPLAMHRTGFRSASTISGVSRSSSAKRSTSSRSAARSRRGRPRDPSSCVVTCSDPLISSSASTSVFGGRRKAAVPGSPPCRPPSPTAITRPNSGSLTVPTSRSAPGGIRRCTIAPIHGDPVCCTRRSSSRQPPLTAASPSRPSRTASMSPA